MSIADALSSITGGSIYDAMKRPAMGGYFFRSAISTATGTEGDFTLTLRKRENSNSNPVDYVYSYDASADAWTAPSTKPELTGELFGEFTGDDWIVGKASDFENARIPSGADEW